MLNVVNCKYSKYDVYIGRGSKWGNPFHIGIHGGREEVIRKYEKYLLNNSYLMGSLHELKDKTLGCFCKPKNCHGDVLVKHVNKRCSLISEPLKKENLTT